MSFYCRIHKTSSSLFIQHLLSTYYRQTPHQALGKHMFQSYLHLIPAAKSSSTVWYADSQKAKSCPMMHQPWPGEEGLHAMITTGIHQSLQPAMCLLSRKAVSVQDPLSPVESSIASKFPLMYMIQSTAIFFLDKPQLTPRIRKAIKVACLFPLG